MKEQMLKLSRKKIKAWLIVWAIVLVASIVACAPLLIGRITGPVSIDTLREGVPEDEYVEMDKYDDLENKYVSIEVQYVLEQYYADRSNSSSRPDRGYLVYDYKSGYCIGIYVEDEYYDILEEMEDKTWQWLYGETDELPEPLVIKGTFRKMDNKESYEYAETAESMSSLFSYEEYDYYPTYEEYALMYTIDTKEINGWPVIIEKFALVVAAIAITGLIYVFVVLFTEFKYGKINRFLAKYSINEADAESDFNASKNIGNIYVGKKFTYIIEGTAWKMCRNDDIVWAYYHRITGKTNVSRIEAYHYDKSCTFLNASKAVSEQVLEYYGQVFPHMMIGYNADLLRTYRKDFQTFLTYRYIPAKQREAQNAYGNATDVNSQSAYNNNVNNNANATSSEPTSSTQKAVYNTANAAATAAGVATKEEPEIKVDEISEEIAKNVAKGLYSQSGSYTVKFVTMGDQKVKTIKYIREMLELGLAEAKEIVDEEGVIQSNLSYESADAIKKVLEKVGNRVTVDFNMF